MLTTQSYLPSWRARNCSMTRVWLWSVSRTAESFTATLLKSQDTRGRGRPVARHVRFIRAPVSTTLSTVLSTTRSEPNMSVW